MKIKKWIKENYKKIFLDLTVFIIIALMITPKILQKGIGDLDELWNYNFARNIADGLVPYRDFNMVQTPLLPMIAGTILKIFTNELIIMRVLAILLQASVIFMLYLTLKRIGVNKKLIAVGILLLVYDLSNYICIDYNYAVLLIALIIMYIEIFNKDNLIKSDLKKDIIIGLLAGISILFKQSIGIIIAIVAIFYKIPLLRSKKDAKEIAKIIVYRIIAALIPIIILIIYLNANNALNDFIDYAILGIQTFSNKISYFDFIKNERNFIKISVAIPITLFISYVYSVIRGKNELNTITSYSIGMFALIYPISDSIHFFIASIPSFVLCLYLIDKTTFIKIKQDLNLEFKRKIERYLKIFIQTSIELLIIVTISLDTLSSLQYIFQYKNQRELNVELNHYKYIQMSDEQIEMINEVDKYIVNNKNNVYILDSDAVLFMIPINRYNKDFDMFLKGNLGKKGEKGQMEKIEKLDQNSEILIKNDAYNRNWQNPDEVTNYIKNNLRKIGEIAYFDIYVK